MGVDYRGAIFVGVPRSELVNKELIYDEKVEICPPYYDGDADDDAIAGFPYKETSDYDNCELEWDQRRVDQLKEEFEKLTGQEARVFLCTKGH